LCVSIKCPYLPHGRSLEIPRGRGLSNAKVFQQKNITNLEFPEGKGGGEKRKDTEKN